MEDKKYKGSCGDSSARQVVGEPAVGSRLAGASLPQQCQYYHLTDTRTHCLQRAEVISLRMLDLYSRQGPRFFLQAIFLICSGSQEGRVGSWYLGLDPVVRLWPCCCLCILSQGLPPALSSLWWVGPVKGPCTCQGSWSEARKGYQSPSSTRVLA